MQKEVNLHIKSWDIQIKHIKEMKKSKLLFSLFMAVFMMAISPVKVWADDVASVKIGDETTNYSSITAAFNAANVSGQTSTITMLADYSDNTWKDPFYSFSYGTITLDLNGHKIQPNTNTAIKVSGASLTIVDNGANKDGLIKGIQYSSGTLQLCGGTFTNHIAVSKSSDWNNICGEGYYLVYENGDAISPNGTAIWNQTIKVKSEAASEDDAVASVTISDNTKYYASFAKAIEAAQKSANAEVKLLSDIALSINAQYCVELKEGEYTIDLNGKKIAGSQAWESTFGISGANVTIVDKSVGLEGLISCTTESAIVYNSGNLTIEGGTFNGSKYAINLKSISLSADGYVTLHGGTFTGNPAINIYNAYQTFSHIGLGEVYIAVNPSTGEELTTVQGATSFSVKRATLPLTISAALYATYYNSQKAYIMPEGCTGYIWNDALVATYAAGSTVPAGEALVISGAQGEYSLAVTTTSAQPSANNALRGTDEAEELEADADSYFYGFSYGPTGTEYAGKLGFYWRADEGAAFKNGAHKAYLKLAKSQTSAKGFPFEDLSTAIKSVNANRLSADAPIYNLAGQRVSADTKGILIQNGKKFINK